MTNRLISIPVIVILFAVCAAAMLLLLAPLVEKQITMMAAQAIEMPAPNHADIRHGAEAGIARECRDGWELRMHNPTTNRTGLLCLTSAGRVGIVILDEAGREVTAFLRKSTKTMRDTIEYMERAGYRLLQ